MYRPWMSVFPYVLFILPIAAPPLALAQLPMLNEEMVGPNLDLKELAKARFEADQATLGNLAKARRDAIKKCFQIRYQMYLTGSIEPGMGRPVTFNSILTAGAELAEAELALSDKPADQLAIRARNWLLAWETYEITGAQYVVGHVSHEALLRARRARLAAEIKLLEVVKRKERSAPFLMSAALFHPEKVDAKRQFETTQAETSDLAEARKEALRECFQERYGLYRAGANEPGRSRPVMLNFLLDTWAELVEEGTALSTKPADRSAIPASHWLYTWETERMAAMQYRRGYAPHAALLQARSALLDDEIKLWEVLKGKEQSAPFLMLPAFLDGDALYSAEGIKELAKAQFEASQCKPHDLALARRNALKARLVIRRKLYLAAVNEPGTFRPVTLDVVKEAEARLREAEADMSNKPADRLAAYEKNWEAKYLAEEIAGRMWRVGRLSTSALARARFARLGAEIRLLEAQAKLKK